VTLHGLWGKPQGPCNIEGSEPLTDEEKDLQFPIGKALDGGFGGSASHSRCPGDEALGDVLTEGIFPPQQRQERLPDLREGSVFHEIPTGPGADGPEGIEGFLMHAQYEDEDVGTLA
jgi:hypothetical protein